MPPNVPPAEQQLNELLSMWMTIHQTQKQKLLHLIKKLFLEWGEMTNQTNHSNHQHLMVNGLNKNSLKKKIYKFSNSEREYAPKLPHISPLN